MDTHVRVWFIPDWDFQVEYGGANFVQSKLSMTRVDKRLCTSIVIWTNYVWVYIIIDGFILLIVWPFCEWLCVFMA